MLRPEFPPPSGEGQGGGLNMKPRTPPDLLEKARALRSNPTDAEKALWKHLRNRQVEGRRFRRQVPIGRYIVDFVCEAERLIVDVDGGQHAEPDADTRRTAYLNTRGYSVLRFRNDEVLANMEGVLERIAQGSDVPHPGPPPGGEGTLVASAVLQELDRADFTLSLGYEQRYRRRGVMQTDCGLSFLLDLAEATELASGAGLLLGDGRTIAVKAAVEPLTEIRGTGLARLAWHIGNRHTPCQVEPERLLIQRDHVLEDMLRRLGAEVAHVEEPFQPEGGAYGHGRTHGHSHRHDPHDDPNAHIPHRHDPV